MVARETCRRREKGDVILHRIEPRYTSNDEGGLNCPQGLSQGPARRPVGPHRLGVDAVRNDRDPVRWQPARDGVRAHGPGVRNDEIGTRRKPHFRPIGQRVQRAVTIDLHAAGAQSEHQFRLEP